MELLGATRIKADDSPWMGTSLDKFMSMVLCQYSLRRCRLGRLGGLGRGKHDAHEIRANNETMNWFLQGPSI